MKLVTLFENRIYSNVLQNNLKVKYIVLSDGTILSRTLFGL